MQCDSNILIVANNYNERSSMKDFSKCYNNDFKRDLSRK